MSRHTSRTNVVSVFYVISMLAAAAGVVVVLTLMVRLAGPTRRLAGTVHRSRAHFADQVGLLAARIAALRVSLDHLRNRSELPPNVCRVASTLHPR
jgi:hypothetical protein